MGHYNILKKKFKSLPANFVYYNGTGQESDFILFIVRLWLINKGVRK